MSDNQPVRRSVAELCTMSNITEDELASKAGLDKKRVRAILEGRWLPSPQERQHIASALGVEAEQISWGHRATVEHLYGHGPQFGRTP
jgi:transcriptional regulator with XRE-family HTH domain